MEYDNSNRRHKSQGDGSGLFPDDIYDIIVSFLPIRDAIRSSLVSRAWRFRWRSIPYLEFIQKDPISTSDPDERLREIGEKNARFVSRVLLLHEGRITRFGLSYFLHDSDLMDVWIPALTVVGIQEFYLIGQDPEYLVHSDIFSFHSLTVLVLASCTVQVPPEDQFSGFLHLTYIALHDIILRDPCNTRTLGRLITSCPGLKDLSLENVVSDHGDMSGFEASAPNLKLLKLHMVASFGPICIAAPKVSVASISVTTSESDTFAHEDIPRTFTVINTLSGINNVESLAIDSAACVQAFPFATVPSELPFELPSLKDLEMVASFEHLDESIAAICILRSAPMLRYLRVKSGVFEPEGLANNISEKHDGEGCKLHHVQLACKLNHLQTLVFDSIKLSEEEVAFIKFVLQNAPFVSKIYITTESDAGCVDHLVKDLLSVKKDTAHGTLWINDTKILF